MRRLPLLLLVTLAAACASDHAKKRIAPRFTIEEVPTAIEASRADLDAGRSTVALERLRSAKNTVGLPADLRQRVQLELELAAIAVIQDSDDPGDLEDLTDVDIPRHMAVAAGIRAAELHVANGKRMKAFRTLRRLDEKFPQHAQRARSAQILYELGADIAADEGRYWIFFRKKTDAPQVLEYLVLHHPTSAYGDEALVILSEYYEEERKFQLAIEKHLELVLWYPESVYVAESQAAVPRLRLTRLASPEYDRTEMSLALAECEEWLETNVGADPALTESVEDLRLDAIRRMIDHDLIVARFYAKVDSPEGVRLHATRALDLAVEGGVQEQRAEAKAMLDSLGLGTGS